MSLLVWTASAMVACSLPLAWWAVVSERPAGQRASRNLVSHAPTLREAELRRSVAERLLLPVTRSLGGWLVRFTPIGWIERRNSLLARAGLSGRVSAEQVLGAKILVAAVLAASLGLRLVGNASVRLVTLTLVCIAIGFFVPDLLMRAKADRRADAITRALPDVLDQVTISVEAGLGFELALHRISEGSRIGGGSRVGKEKSDPLAEELLRMLQDIRLGSSRADALTALAQRSQVDDLKSVVLTLRQADSLGVPMSTTLRTLSTEMREKRRFRAEERAHRLPTLLIFPLGLCILPALFIIVLGPSIIANSGN